MAKKRNIGVSSMLGDVSRAEEKEEAPKKPEKVRATLLISADQRRQLHAQALAAGHDGISEYVVDALGLDA